MSFLHLLWSIASSLFSLRVWHSFCTTSLQVFFGLPLSLAPSTSYSIYFFTVIVSFLQHTNTDISLIMTGRLYSTFVWHSMLHRSETSPAAIFCIQRSFPPLQQVHQSWCYLLSFFNSSQYHMILFILIILLFFHVLFQQIFNFFLVYNHFIQYFFQTVWPCFILSLPSALLFEKFHFDA